MNVELVPLGAPELGMTRAEMLEHIDFLWSYIHTQIDFMFQIIFAWLIAMFFTAKKLRLNQFIAAHIFYLLFLVRQYFAISDSQIALAVWYDRIGLPEISHADTGDTFSALYQRYLGGSFDQFLFFAVVLGTIWWSISCRREVPSHQEIGAPD